MQIIYHIKSIIEKYDYFCDYIILDQKGKEESEEEFCKDSNLS